MRPLEFVAKSLDLPYRAVEDGLLAKNVAVVTLHVLANSPRHDVVTRYEDNPRGVLACVTSYLLEGKSFTVSYE